MKTATCSHCSGGIKYVVLEVDRLLGRWVHYTGGRACKGATHAWDVATPKSGTVKRNTDDVQVTHPGLG